MDDENEKQEGHKTKLQKDFDFMVISGLQNKEKLCCVERNIKKTEH